MEEPELVARIFWPTTAKRFAKARSIQVMVHSRVDGFGTRFDKFCASPFLKSFSKKKSL